jgi:hypothetical protein
MDDKFIQSYLQCIGQVKPTKNIVKENAKPKSKKKLIKEQAENETYSLTFCIADPRWDDDSTWENDDGNVEKRLNETVKEQDWFKVFEKYGGDVAGEGHDSGEMTGQNAGDLCFDIVINRIPKQKLFELANETLFTADEGETPFTVLEWVTIGLYDGDEVAEFEKTPDGVVECLQNTYEEGWTTVPEFEKDDNEGIDDEHTNLDAPENSDDI